MYKITWPDGVGNPCQCSTWDEVNEHIEDFVTEAVDDNQQQIMQGAMDDVPDKVYGHYRNEAAPKFASDVPLAWTSKILASYGDGGTGDTYYALSITKDDEVYEYKTDFDTSVAAVQDLLISLQWVYSDALVRDVQAAMIAGNEGDFSRSIGTRGLDAATILDAVKTRSRLSPTTIPNTKESTA